MCGIGAIVSTSWSSERQQQALSSLRESLLHRGPDGNGMLQVSPEVGLVHTRLAFLDLSERGAQPMYSRCGRYCISFNGEIYNFRELRADLIQEGRSFNTESDTEVILESVAVWGVDAFTRFRGMFSFVLHDKEANIVYAVRDPFGIKPLYYSTIDGALCCASEVRALRRMLEKTPKLSVQGLYSFFLFGSVYEPHTIYESVHQVPSGSYLRWENGVHTIESYESLQRYVGAGREGGSESIESLAAHLEESVAVHCIADVPVGVLLSGGLDSSLILHCARHSIPDLHSFSIGFENASFNEADAAQETAKHYQTKHHTRILTKSYFEKLWSSFFEAMDQPTVDGLNVYAVCGMLREQNIKAALSGLGGDELFSGYSSFQRFPWVHGLARLLSWYPGGLPSRVHRQLPSAYARLFDSILRGGSEAESYQGIRGIFPLSDAGLLTKTVLAEYQEGTPSLPELRDLLPVQTVSEHTSTTVSLLELCGYMRNQLLRDSDVFAMAHGIELRVPFVDMNLFKAIRKMDQSKVLASNKQCLRNAFSDLPEHVLKARKHGFIIPYRQWIQEDLSKDFSHQALAVGVHSRSWYCRWSLYVLERYLQHHRV